MELLVENFFVMAALKSLSDNYNICFISLLVCVDCLFRLKLRFSVSWCARFFYYILDTLGILSGTVDLI